MAQSGLSAPSQSIQCGTASNDRFRPITAIENTGAAFQLAAKNIPVKRNHVLKIVHPDDDMVDVGDVNGVSLFHEDALY